MNNMSFRQYITRHLANIPGWYTNRKIVVIESDDWGSIRMPSLETLHKLINKNINFSWGLNYERNDTLASPSDLGNLFDVLSSVKDKNNNPAVITANCVVANPDFEKINASCFSEYHYELMTETMSRYYPQSNPFILWKEGLKKGLFYPQFHGREHLNVQLWLNSLINNVNGVRDAFEETVFSQVMTIPNDPRAHVLSAYDYENESEQPFICTAIKEGLDIFEKLFGYRSASAISPCFVWDDFVEKCLWDEGVTYIQGISFQHYSTCQKKRLNKKGKYHFCGNKNKLGQYYLVRNCSFEPSQYPAINYVDECLKRIHIAFLWRKPAIISTHRLNFIGTLNERNRDVNLQQLKMLLKEIVRLWPETEFLTSDKLGDIIREV